MAAKLRKGKLYFKFCVLCHRIHIVGRWQIIDSDIEHQLKKNFGKWQANMTVCEDCGEEEKDEGGDA